MEMINVDNSLDIDFSMYDIGRDYYQNNKKCIFDIIREILVIETPKEVVRQKFIRYLIEELEVPKNKIDVEVSMTQFEEGSRGRADIVVYGENEEGYNIPIILIECKAPSVAIVDDSWFKTYEYDEILGTDFIIITNGSETYAAIYDGEDEQYYYIEELPKYKQLLSDSKLKFVKNDSEGWEKPDFKDLLSNKNIEQFIENDWLAENTSRDLYPLIMNLGGFIFDTKIHCLPIKLDDVNIIEDGHRFASFGNAGGGWWTGDFKYFIIEDDNGNNQIISVSILNSYLVISVDDFDKRHNSLQLNLDKYTKVEGNKFTIWHDGTLTVGRSGAAKRKEVIDYVSGQEPTMVNSDGVIILGTFDCNKEILWSQDNTKQFIKNLIKYAILRDEFRRMKQGI